MTLAANLAALARRVVGTAANNLVALDGAGNLPVVSGANLTGLAFTEFYESSEISIVVAGTFSVTHGLSEIPKVLMPFLKCKATELGYAVGSMVPINSSYVYDGSSSGIGLSISSTTISGVVGNGGNIVPILNITTGNKYSITPANWRIVLRAFA